MPCDVEKEILVTMDKIRSEALEEGRRQALQVKGAPLSEEEVEKMRELPAGLVLAAQDSQEEWANGMRFVAKALLLLLEDHDWMAGMCRDLMNDSDAYRRGVEDGITQAMGARR